MNAERQDRKEENEAMDAERIVADEARSEKRKEEDLASWRTYVGSWEHEKSERLSLSSSTNSLELLAIHPLAIHMHESHCCNCCDVCSFCCREFRG
jgi:hypothetical protein